jgi:hypothetical protein
MATKYIKWPCITCTKWQYHHFSTPKFTQIVIFDTNMYHLATLGGSMYVFVEAQNVERQNVGPQNVEMRDVEEHFFFLVFRP